MKKYLIFALIIFVVAAAGYGFYYNKGTSEMNTTRDNMELPIPYPDYDFPVYEDSVVNMVVEGEEDSVTISFLSKDDKDDITTYYRSLLSSAYEISKSNDGKEYNSMGMKGDYVYSITVADNREKYNNENYNTLTTIGVMPLDDEFKQDMDNMTEKEKEIMLIWFKAISEMD